MLSIKNILHPTDFSSLSEKALEVAYALAADYRAHLTVLHVVQSPFLFGDGVIFSNAADGGESIRDELVPARLEAGQVHVTRRVEEGNAAMEILNVARLSHADLIVMGTHGRHGLKRWFMGSVAEEVMRKAGCPVLTVSVPSLDERTTCEAHRLANQPARRALAKQSAS